MEYREFRVDPVGVNDEGKLYGVAVPFSRETTIGDPKNGGWREEVAPGACKKSIREGDVVFLAHHDMHMPLARTSAGNLSLREDGEKLNWEATPVDTSYGRDIRALADAKVLGGVSIGFRPVKDEWRDDDGNPSDRLNGTHRILREIKLIEISAVTNPAYKDTSIMARDELLAERETRAGSPKPYGDETYADPKNGKYPLTEDGKLSSKRIHAAWAYISMPKNAGKYPLNGVSLSSVKAKIKSAAAKIDMKISDEKSGLEPDELRNPYEDSFYENDGTYNPDERSEFPDLTALAAELVKAYNLLPEDLREQLPEDFRTAVEAVAEDRDDPDGKEHACIDEALRHLRKTPPDVKGAVTTLQENQTGRRDDPDGREYEVIDRALRLLRESPPDVKGAISALEANQKWGRGKSGALWDRSSQEPEASTPDSDEDDIALRIAMRQAKERSRELGFI